MNQEKLSDALNILRDESSDNQYYEAKAAVEGMPGNLLDTISAFSNTPGGGVLLLGVDENSSFTVVGVYDAKKCQQTLANYAKNGFNTTIDMKCSLIAVDAKKVVWVDIKEADKTLKPVKIKGSGKAFVRLYDGDFELSEQEEQLFVAARGPSRFDEDAIPGSSSADLDTDLVKDYITNRKSHSAALAKMSDEDVLFRTGVTDRNGELTKAGAAALGVYPQQFMPNYSIKVSLRKTRGRSERVRAVNVNSIDGPIPTMLEEALKWVEDNTDEITVDMANGRVKTMHEYPLAAVRELVANSLIHRDMNPMSMFQSISLTIDDDKLVISNPGGLYGLSLRDLGHTGSKTRNARLAEICQFLRAEDGINVIEKLGSGIPKVLEELSALDMQPPIFYDGGIYFTAILKSAEFTAPVVRADASAGPGNEAKVQAALRGGALSRSDIEKRAGLSTAQVRYALNKLLGESKVRKFGDGSSPNTKYGLA
jgi:ATP-dependent DNA helicase RecG